MSRNRPNGGQSATPGDAGRAPEARPDTLADLEAVAEAIAPPRPRPAAPRLATSALLVVLTLGLMVATAAGLCVVGLALAVWPALLLDAAVEGGLGARWPVLAAMLAAPVAVFLLYDRSWRAFARARTGRSADFMLVALAATLALHAAVLGAS
jgi:hypothetical protein